MSETQLATLWDDELFDAFFYGNPQSFVSVRYIATDFVTNALLRLPYPSANDNSSQKTNPALDILSTVKNAFIRNWATGPKKPLSPIKWVPSFIIHLGK